MSCHSGLQPLIVKLGGSLYSTSELVLWLKALKKLSEHQPIIIVPGGGPFADQVRSAQAHHHFNDSTAHQMALLAMKQFGLLLLALETHCHAFHDHDHIAYPPLSVWLPDESLLTAPSLAHTWDNSSDSLALYLSHKLNATRLVLIKRVNTHLHSIAELSLKNILDRGFSTLFSHAAITTQIVHYQQYQAFANVDDPIHNALPLSLP